jgi:hypothetical protein
VCLKGSSSVGVWGVPSSNVRNWTAGYTKGATQITLDSVSGVSVGMVLILDQIDDTSDTGGIIVNGQSVSAFSIEGAAPGRPNRTQTQYVKVTAISGNQVTISPGLYMTNWRSAKSPQAWFWGSTSQTAVANGIEDLTLDHSASTADETGLMIWNAYGCWVKNVKSVSPNRNHIWLYQSAHSEVRDSYFFGTKNAASQSYGVESFMTSDNLVMNNIFQHVTTPIMTGPASGNVTAYNYTLDMYYSVVLNWMMAGTKGSHDTGTGMNLFEGNESNSFGMDLYHGPGALPTAFRNYFSGRDGSRTSNTEVVYIWAYNRFVNFVGNVLGTPGYHTVYEDSRGPQGQTGNPNQSIFLLGYSGVDESLETGIAYDLMTVTSLLRWGNFDYATNTTRWNASEIPSDNAVPANHTLPASLFLTTKPSWWGTMPWPAIGPDVTGGFDQAGHVYKNPAHLCYDISTKNADGSLIFDPAQCYGNTPADTTPPTVSITAPSSGATVTGTVTVTATASDNVAVAGVQFRLDGVDLGAEVTSAPYSRSWNTTSSANGSHSLSAIARDSSGNTRTSTTVTVTVSNVPDTTAPSVPSNVTASAVSFSQINVTWTASTDNGGVTGYRVLRCQGAGCSPTVQVAAPTTTSYVDTTVAAATSYSYDVAAVDGANNVSAAARASATTPALPLPTVGLIAAYGFNEGLGTSAADASPNRNTGTLNGPTWTSAGKFGSGLTFDGTTDFVEAADIDALSPQSDATFQAWVRLTSAPTEVATIFNKWSQTADDEYMFGINPNRTLYFAWQTTGGTAWPSLAYGDASGTGVIPLNTLTHIAVVRSGSTLRFYINGNLDTVLSNVMDANPFHNGITTLRIGGQGRGARNRFVPGVIDEAYIYNRALSQAEIQSYMNTTLTRAPAPPTNVRIVQ